jgi:hypothetical protein
MTGAGDERTRELHLRALAFSGFVVWALVTAWYVISTIAGDTNEPIAVVALVFGGAYLGAALYTSRRG